MNTNTAILVVSFGTAVKTTRAKTLDSIEYCIRHAFPDLTVYHAWTSQILRNKVWETEQLSVFGIAEAMTQMAQDGVKRVLVQPTFVSDGTEYQQMIRETKQWAESFDSVQIGPPLLGTVPFDQSLIASLIDECPLPTEQELLIFMGHGTADGDNLAYEALNRQFHSLGHTNIFLKTMKSSASIDEMIQAAKERHVQQIILAPFMIVAGGHAMKDMSGDGESSWKSRLEAAGFSVRCVLKGLGEYECIRHWMVQQIKKNI